MQKVLSVVTFLLLLGPLAGPVQAQELSGNQMQNVDSAIKVLDSFGLTAQAQSVRDGAKMGDYSAGSVKGANAETSTVDGRTVVDTTTIGAAGGKPFDPSTRSGFFSTVKLAKTLVHERVHSGQQYILFGVDGAINFFGGQNLSELEGWSAGFSVEMTIIDGLQAKLEQQQASGANPEQVLDTARKLSDVADLFAGDLGEFQNSDYGDLEFRWHGETCNTAQMRERAEALSAKVRAEVEQIQARVEARRTERGTMGEGSAEGGSGGSGPINLSPPTDAHSCPTK